MTIMWCFTYVSLSSILRYLNVCEIRQILKNINNLSKAIFGTLVRLKPFSTFRGKTLQLFCWLVEALHKMLYEMGFKELKLKIGRKYYYGMVLGFEKWAERLHVSHEVISLSWPLGMNQILEVEARKIYIYFKYRVRMMTCRKSKAKQNKKPNK